MTCLILLTAALAVAARAQDVCLADDCIAVKTEDEVEAELDADVGAMAVELLQKKVRTPALTSFVGESAPWGSDEKASVARVTADESVASVDVDKTTAESGVANMDHNGKTCLLCGKPLPERVGEKVYKEGRSDCGNLSSAHGPSSEVLTRPFGEFSLAQGTNKYCELNFAKSCADAIHNEDYLYWAKSIDMRSQDFAEHRHWDASYCAQNGFLERDIVALQHNFTATRDKAKELCETKYAGRGIERMTLMDMFATAKASGASRRPSLDEAERQAAWTCGMGDLGCDLAWCAYSFCKRSGDEEGLYEECEGWHPVRGMATS